MDFLRGWQEGREEDIMVSESIVNFSTKNIYFEKKLRDIIYKT